MDKTNAVHMLSFRGGVLANNPGGFKYPVYLRFMLTISSPAMNPTSIFLHSFGYKIYIPSMLLSIWSQLPLQNVNAESIYINSIFKIE